VEHQVLHLQSQRLISRGLSYSILPKLASRRGINLLPPRDGTHGRQVQHPVALAKLAHTERQSASIPVPQEPLVRV
jgi:hypothetical protein